MVDASDAAAGQVQSDRFRPSADDDAALLRLVLVVAVYCVGGLASFVALTVMGWAEASGWDHVVKAGADALLALVWPITWAAALGLYWLT